jgi:hypothetical protein
MKKAAEREPRRLFLSLPHQQMQEKLLMTALSQTKKPRKPRRGPDDFKRDIAAKAAAKTTAAEAAAAEAATKAVNGGAAENQFLPPDRVDFSKLKAADDEQEEVTVTPEATTASPEQFTADVHQRATEAWTRLTSTHTLADWFVVGDSLMADRTAAMHKAGTNIPRGKKYCAAFGNLLAKRPFAELEKTTRTRLLQVMEKRPIIEAWLAKQPLSKQLELNHSHSVLRAWKTSLKPKKSKTQPTWKKKRDKLEAENDRLRQQLNGEADNDDGDGDSGLNFEDTPTDIAKALVANLNTKKVKAVIIAMTKLLESV